MELFSQIIDVFLHLNQHLADIISQYGTLTYALLFAVIFAETGLVILPFLPGDSLLFASGAFVALGALDGLTLASVLTVAAIAGDSLNYSIGQRIGPQAHRLPWINQQHLTKAELFYQRYGVKTIVLARFVPIVRTFAPFVAGISRMPYRTFIIFNIVGALAWVVICVVAGYWFGNIPVVQRHFEWVILGIVIVSLLPVVIEWFSSRRPAQE
jgi:membrane-associated protein